MAEFEPVLTARWGDPDAVGLDGYLRSGGYQGLGKALAVTALGVGVHLVEANFVAPVVMERQVNIPPVLTIAGVLLIGRLLACTEFMETPSTALQLLEYLRKEEKDWRSARWSYLILSAIPLIGNLYVIWKYRALIQGVEEIFKEKSLEAGFYLSLGASAALITALFGALGLGHVLGNWKGSRTRQLLILMAERDLDAPTGTVGVALANRRQGTV